MISLGTSAARVSPALRCIRRSPRTTACFRTSLRVHRDRRAPDKFNYNANVFDPVANPEHVNYRRVTANDLEKAREPPTEVRMLVRDFIEDSLYNPNYGYFPRQAQIFTYSEGSFDFGSVKNAVEFQEEVARRYESYGADEDGPGRQIWHTPTELFKVIAQSCKYTK
jgi:hypothetical protein